MAKVGDIKAINIYICAKKWVKFYFLFFSLLLVIEERMRMRVRLRVRYALYLLCRHTLQLHIKANSKKDGAAERNRN